MSAEKSQNNPIRAQSFFELSPLILCFGEWSEFSSFFVGEGAVFLVGRAWGKRVFSVLGDWRKR